MKNVKNNKKQAEVVYTIQKNTDSNFMNIEEKKSDDVDTYNRYTDIEKKMGNNVICCNNIILGYNFNITCKRKSYYSMIFSILLISFPVIVLFYLLIKVNY